MKQLYRIVIFLIAAAGPLAAQPYGNEWIAFASGQAYSSQQYFRIGIWKEGVYRIGYNDLQSSGVPVTSWFSTDRYQIFHRGKEQFIRVKDQNSDNLFGPGDYIEFYGKSNDGEYDRALYDVPASQPNPYFSLYNDTAAYFLTYNPFSNNNRRMPVVTDNNYGAYQPEPWYIREDVKVYGSTYNISYRDFNDIADNSFTKGEGYLSGLISKSSPFDVNYNISNYAVTGPAPEIETTIMGANANNHPYRFSSSGTVLFDSVFYGYDMATHRFTIGNLPQAGTWTFQFAPQNDPIFTGNLNYMQMAYARLRYPRSFDFTGQTFPQSLILEGNNPKVLIQLTNAVLSTPLMYIISGDTVKLATLDQSIANNLRSIIPLYGNSQRCYLLAENQVFNFTGNAVINPVNPEPDPLRYARFSNYTEQGSNADFLMVTNRSLWSGAQSYASYRNSKGYNVLLADVNELYDQFAWGIRKHVLAIRHFADQMLDQVNPKPKYLLLLGKSVASPNARAGNDYNLNLVPTYGEPPSDQMFTAHLNTTIFKPELATGRIAAQNNTDLQAYLNKLIAFEQQQTLPPALWMKNVLHFGGGTDIGEQNILASKLNNYKRIIEDTLFGGNVTTTLKSSTDPIQINLSQYIQQLIDSGCSMMTFYGHAAGTSFDISTDDPENYNNRDRYPVVLAQSCFVGDIHTSSRLLNERFVLTPEKGSVAFIAVPDKGIIEPLDDYSLKLHEVLFRDQYGISVGEGMKSVVEQIINNGFDRKSICMNMTLHGDPAIHINSYEKPDYEVSNASIFFEPANVTTENDSFTVKVAVTNLGKNVSDRPHLLISRTLPGGAKRDTILQLPKYISYRDTFGITLPVDFRNGAGLNQFEVTIDIFEEVDEIDNVGNNVARNTLQINSTDINPVYPQKYAIVPNTNVTLKATTANLFADPKTYRFEVDTTPFFNSNLKKSGTVPNAYGIVSWTIPAVLDTNITWFWRVANDSIMNPDTAVSNRYQWRESSFLVKPGKTGWSQAHYYQFKEAELVNLVWNDSARIAGYINSNYSLNMSHEGARPSYEINGVNMDYGGCFGLPQLAVAVMDSINFEKPWEADSCERYYGNYNHYSCNTFAGCGFRTRPDKFFLFNTGDPTSISSMVDMMTNKVPDGNYLLSWSVFTANFDTLNTLKAAYNALGVPQFSSLVNGDKFMMFMKKGDPSSVIFDQGRYPDSILRIDYLLSRSWDKGFMLSSPVGPARSWSELRWDYSTLESNSQDSISLQVIGVAPSGQEVLLIDSIVSPAQPTDLSGISAQQYPSLRIRAYVQDLQNRTPPQMRHWQIYYDPVPEGALNTRFYSFEKDTLQEGENINLNIAFENISSVNMDTLRVNYFVIDANNVRRNIASVRLHRDLPAGDTIQCRVNFSTLSYLGSNSLWVEVNPNLEKPEQYFFNNVASLRFRVNADRTNPLLDVTFDGARILNGDIVSARPLIQIQLNDENRFIALNDTSNFRITLRDPDGNLRFLRFEPTPGSNSSSQLLSWVPASLPKNSFRIEYRPELMVDGTYELTVQATDETGNQSGLRDYKIQFEVINRSTITEVVNYPNPFSTSTRFVFVLTGSEVPTDFRIRIMTVSGKVVREIMRDELGPIRIGRNVTDYAWDGRDEFGDQLANGVYLYQVTTGINGQEIEKRSSGADQYFKKGWGKMYLMR